MEVHIVKIFLIRFINTILRLMQNNNTLFLDQCKNSLICKMQPTGPVNQ